MAEPVTGIATCRPKIGHSCCRFLTLELPNIFIYRDLQ
jgi:hypothetical protein